ncbi:RAD55 family ATPase [Halohasta litorea]|uniref:RAD55 family ATPase n=1 Tax=Halohasta litorea TaxID=869891 RepID=A0ABD6D4C0_9EURY|nr:ATPase domain-containing protein [Halohasta litorea]MEA1930903.1 ATPase domain-containing protein [Euryarchaeota archaeon]
MRVSSGVEGFDRLVDGGFPEDRLYVLSGPPGSGKTTFSAQFMAAGAAEGDTSLYVSMHETRDGITTDMGDFDFGFEEALESDSITFLDALSSEGRRFFGGPGEKMDRTNVTNRLAGFINSRDIDRVVIDSTMLLRYLFDDSDTTLMRFLTAIKRTSATTLLISEMTDPSAYADEHFLAHGVVFFHNYLEDDGMRRGIQVIKMRGTDVDTDIRTLSFGPKGLKVTAGTPVN